MLRLLRNDTVIAMGGYVVQLVLTFGTGVIVAHVLGPGDYGLLNILRNLLATLATLAVLGLDVALLKYCGAAPPGDRKTEALVSRLRQLTGLLNLIIVLIAFMLSSDLELKFYPYANFALLFSLTMLALPMQTDVLMLGAVYKARNEASFYNLSTTYLQSIARVVMIVGALFYFRTILAVVIINVLQVAFSSLALLLHEFRRSRAAAAEARTADAPPVSDVRVGWRDVSAVMGVSLWLAVSAIVVGIMRGADMLVLGAGYATAREIGAYAALGSVAQLVQMFPMAASQSLGPNVSRHYFAGDMASVHRALNEYIYLSSIVSGFVFAGVAVFGERLNLVFGHGFEFNPLVCFLLPFGYLFSATLAPMGYALSMTGRHRFEVFILSLGCAILVGSCWLLTPRFGPAGAAASVVLGFAATNVMRFAYVSKSLGFIPGELKDLASPAVALAIAYLCKLAGGALGAVTLATTFVTCLAYAAAFFAVAFFFLFDERTKARVGRVYLSLLGKRAIH